MEHLNCLGREGIKPVPPYDRDRTYDLQTLKVLLLTPALRTLHMCTRYVEDGWSAAKIAKEMNMSEAAARKLIGRALKKLDALNGTLPSRFEVNFLKRR